MSDLFDPKNISKFAAFHGTGDTHWAGAQCRWKTATIFQNASAAAPAGNFLTTETSDALTTESGDNLLWEA